VNIKRGFRTKNAIMADLYQSGASPKKFALNACGRVDAICSLLGCLLIFRSIKLAMPGKNEYR
jgi:hypothetical protein